MAAAAPRFASAEIRSMARRHAAEMAGLALGLVGLAILVALATYDPRDPSLNTATTRQTANLAGPLGAAFADILLQGFGFAAALPGITMLAWCWRIASRRGLSSAVVRIAALVLAVPVLAAAFGATPVSHVAAWPTVAGLGGATGALLAAGGLEAGQGLLGPLGVAVVWTVDFALAVTLTLIALGLSAGDWHATGRAVRTGQFPIPPWRGTVRTFSHAIGMARSGMSASLFHLRRTGRSTNDVPSPGVRTGLREPTSDLADVGRITKLAGAPGGQRPGPPMAGAGWRLPPLALLTPAPARAAAGPSGDALQANARLLESVLSDYGVKGAIGDIRPGPVVTLYELEPAPGVRSARVIGLADDVARSLSVTAVRIATVPGRNVIGIEVPNARRETVFLSEILSSDEVQRHPGRLPIALGKEIGGTPIVADLARMPHLMIAGTTGSGKSVGVNAMILSLLYRLSPDQCRLIMIDPKMLELSMYEGIPHLMSPVVTEPAKAVTALKWTVREMERRYRAMSQLGVRNVTGYNGRVVEARAKGEVVTRRVQTGFDPETGRPTFEEQPLALEPLPYIVVVVDEMADLMMVAGKEIEAAVQRLAQMARAAGIHVIMATQRPSVDVITGTIKANFPTRISFQVISKFDSRTILGEQGAEQLLGQGDMLYMAGGGRITRVHGPFVTDDEVEKVVAFLREQGEPSYVDGVTELQEDEGGAAPSIIGSGSGGEKDLYQQAVSVVSREGKASTSFIQRHLNIGYNRAAKLIEQMEKEGIVGAANHVGKREVLVRRTTDEEDG
jgi:S-DNA-T family DNA segregation ATPase FtsK/SpoIIIE